MLLAGVLVLVVLSVFLLAIALWSGRRPWVTRYEAMQRGIIKEPDGGLRLPAQRAEPLTGRVKGAIGAARSAKTISDYVGGHGRVNVMLYVDQDKPRMASANTSGGIPICPLCGMPMERDLQKWDRPCESAVQTESDDARWKCLHPFPVLFVPSRDGGE